MRSPLTETIFKVQGMITYVRENLSTDEFMLFLDLLVPERQPETKPVKKTRKKRGKSQRASGMAAAIGDSLQRSRAATATEITGETDEPLHAQRCTCGNAFGHEDHSRPSPNYHEFTSAQSAIAAGGN